MSLVALLAYFARPNYANQLDQLQTTASAPATRLAGSTHRAPATQAPAPTTLSCKEQTVIELDLVSGVVGQPSPIKAARWFVVQGWASGYRFAPDAAWHLGPPDAQGVYVSTNTVMLHAAQLPNHTPGPSKVRGVCAG